MSEYVQSSMLASRIAVTQRCDVLAVQIRDRVLYYFLAFPSLKFTEVNGSVSTDYMSSGTDCTCLQVKVLPKERLQENDSILRN